MRKAGSIECILVSKSSAILLLIHGSTKLFSPPLAVELEISTFVRKTRPDTPNMSQGRGAFIVLEGLDRSGKTTQTAKLVEKIQSLGKPCKLIKFPGLSSPFCSRLSVDRTTTIGKMIDSYLRSAEDLDDRVIHLLFSANRWEARFLSLGTFALIDSEGIKRDLLAGTTVIVDRYVYSGVAFSAAKVTEFSAGG